MKKFLVILWVVGIFAVSSRAQESEEDSEDDDMNSEKEEDDGCDYICPEGAEEDEDCCEGKTCKGFKYIDVKFCQTPEEYEKTMATRKSLGIE